jgi:biopolymer transport protein ExbD
MITRPLDLASRLRPAPRGLDALFYVNVGALALFFTLFGSRFVLAPGLAVDFVLPQVAPAGASMRITDLVIAVPASNMAVVDGAVLDFKALERWLMEQAGNGDNPQRLLVQVSASLPARDLVSLYAMAAKARFASVLVATNRAPD